MRELSPKPSPEEADDLDGEPIVQPTEEQQATYQTKGPAAKPKSLVAKGPRCSLDAVPSWFPPPPPVDQRTETPMQGDTSQRADREATTAEQPGALQQARSEGSQSPSRDTSPSSRPMQHDRSRTRRNRSVRRAKSTARGGKRRRSSSRPHPSDDREQGIWRTTSSRGKGGDKGKSRGKGKESTSFVPMVSEVVDNQLRQWHDAKNDKNWEVADSLRSSLRRKGIEPALLPRPNDRYGGRGGRQSRSRSPRARSPYGTRARSVPARHRGSRNGRKRQRASSSSSSPSPARARRASSPRYSPIRREQDTSNKEPAARPARSPTRASSNPSNPAVLPQQPPPRMDEALLCFRQYMWHHVAEITPIDEAVQKYRTYESSYRKHHAAIYFDNESKSGAIFKELYDPAVLTRKFDMQLINSQFAAQEFIAEVHTGMYKELLLTSANPTPGAGAMVVQKCEVAGHGTKPHFPFDPDVCTLTFDGVPSSLSVWDFHDVMCQLSGFVAVWLAPAKVATQDRVGHVRFKSSDSLALALAKLQGMMIRGSAYVLQPKKVSPRSCHQVDVVPHIMSEPEQIKKDLEHASALLCMWNEATGIPMEPIDSALASIQGDTAKLDLLILYLRRVHHICYYSGLACSNERDLAEQRGVTRLRAPAHLKPSGVRPEDNLEAKWASEHDARIQQLLKEGCPLKRPDYRCSIDQEPLRSRWIKQCQEDTIEVEQAKFRCKRCSKLFRAPEFVHKHLLRAHTELQQELKDAINEERTREAFLADVDAVRSVPLPTFAGASSTAAAMRTIATPARKRRTGWDSQTVVQ